MFEYKIFLGYIAVLIAFAGYSIYLRDIFRNKTKPHAFSWLIWSIMEAIAFAAQTVKHGGAGAWVTGASALISFFIFLLALAKGKKDFPWFDWLALLASFVAILLWWLTKEPVLSVILITLADAAAFIPTFRKGYNKPFEETIAEYQLSTLKHLLGIIALQAYSISTYLYPASLVVTNASFVTLLLNRRSKLRNK